MALSTGSSKRDEFGVRVRVGARHVGIVGAHDLRLAPAQLALERARVDAAREPLRQGRIEAGQFAGALGDAVDRRLVDDAAHEIDEILAGGVALRILQRLPRDTGPRRASAAAAIEGRRAASTQGAWDGCSIQSKSSTGETSTSPLRPMPEIALQLFGDERPAEAAIALAGEEFRRAEAVLFLQPAHDEGREAVDIALDRIEALAHLIAADDAAIAGARRIDEDEVGEIEPGLGVRRQDGRQSTG